MLATRSGLVGKDSTTKQVTVNVNCAGRVG